MSFLNKTFFVVEDHTVTNIGLVQLVEQKTKLKCAGSAFSKSEAKEKLKALASDLTETDSKTSGPPELLILDLFLGEESGLDLLREVRTDYPEIKILVYSMYAKPGILSLVLETGAHGFVENLLQSPFLLRQLKVFLQEKPLFSRILLHHLLPTRQCSTDLPNRNRSSLRKSLSENQRLRFQRN